MPTTTDHGIFYPNSSDPVEVWSDMQTLAESVETKFDAYETWNSWTPTWDTSGSGGGFTSVGGSGVNEGHYMRIGDLVIAQFFIELATGFTVDSGIFHLVAPVVPYDWSGAAFTQAVGHWIIRDDSASPVQNFAGTIGYFGATGFSFGGAVSAGVSNRRVEEAIPITWAAGDIFSGVLNYRAA